MALALPPASVETAPADTATSRFAADLAAGAPPNRSAGGVLKLDMCQLPPQT